MMYYCRTCKGLFLAVEARLHFIQGHEIFMPMNLNEYRLEENWRRFSPYHYLGASQEVAPIEAIAEDGKGIYTKHTFAGSSYALYSWMGVPEDFVIYVMPLVPLDRFPVRDRICWS